MEEHATPYLRRYHDLCATRDAGQISPQQFAAEIGRLRWRDGRGVWWMIDPAGTLLFYDGRSWVTPTPAPEPGHGPVSPTAQGAGSGGPAAPVSSPTRPPVPAAGVSTSTSPSESASPPAATAAPVTAPAIPAAASHAPTVSTEAGSRPASASSHGTTDSRSLLRSVAPLLAVLPSLLCGALWFLYTFIGVFKYEGLDGIDFLTPMIVSGLPVLFWLFKKPLDRLMLPIKPLIQSAPKPLRLGICLAIPVFLGCGCSSLTPSGYFALSVSAFISVIVAGVLMRF